MTWKKLEHIRNEVVNTGVSADRHGAINFIFGDVCAGRHVSLERRQCGMNRPYVICHILSSLDGKINGPFMSGEASSVEFELKDGKKIGSGGLYLRYLAKNAQK